MLPTKNGTDDRDEHRPRSAEDPSPRSVGGRHVVRFSRRHRRQPPRWPLYAGATVLTLLLLLWWLAGR